MQYLAHLINERDALTLAFDAGYVDEKVFNRDIAKLNRLISTYNL